MLFNYSTKFLAPISREEPKKEGAMKKTFLIAAVVLFSIASLSHAGWHDGNELKKFCSSSNDLDQGSCLGFISAATSSAGEHHYCETTKGGGKVLKLSASGECKNQQQLALPEKMKLGQARAVVIKYLDDNPAELHRDAVSIVNSAMIEAFGFRKLSQ
jgi:hypothetical protein